MLRGLEIFWLVITVLALGLTAYEFYAATTRDGLLTLGVAALAGIKYYTRHKQRMAMERGKDK